MKNILLIFLCISFSSCNPFISKDLRVKNRGNRKLERLVKKYPGLIKKDTATVIYDTTIITPNARIDTLLSYDFDTVTLFKDKLRLKLIRVNDTLLIDAECLPDTIRIKEFIKVPFETISKSKLTPLEQAANFASKFYMWGIFILILFLIL